MFISVACSLLLIYVNTTELDENNDDLLIPRQKHILSITVELRRLISNFCKSDIHFFLLENNQFLSIFCLQPGKKRRRS